jgi:hypothetical protein
MRAGIDVNFRPGEAAVTGAEAQARLDYAGLLSSPGVTLDVTDLTNFLSLRAFERERRRVDILQANVLEKQRLRREVGLYKAKAAEREAERLRAVEEQRRRQMAAEAAAQQKAEAAARALAEKKAADEARAAEEAARKAEQQNLDLLPFDPGGVVRGGELTPPQDGAVISPPVEEPATRNPVLNFDALPGVTP